MKKRTTSLLLAIFFLLSGCSAPQQPYTPPDYSGHEAADEANYRTTLADLTKLKDGKPVLVTEEAAADFSKKPFAGFDKKSENWGYDVRSNDISGADLSTIQDWNDLSFNTDTRWSDKLPVGFDPAELLKFNKNPGLGIRALHEEGITGAGVGIAIIDQALLLDHEQYKENLMFYERIHCSDDTAQMHGPAVASIAVGKDIGVAPGAKLYYIAETGGHWTNEEFEDDYSVIADCILRILELNRQLPESEKIRVISISKGYHKGVNGYERFSAAIRQADKEGVFVITTSTDEYYDFSLMGMGRDYRKDPDDPSSFGPADWIEDDFYAHAEHFQKDILVPMGGRTYAGSTGTTDYEIGSSGGMSWAVPWCAGFYALCCQVKPDVTPEEFIAAVKKTAVTTEIEHEGKTYPFGNIIDPAATIAVLKAND